MTDSVPCCSWCGGELPDHAVPACPLRERCVICGAGAGVRCVGGEGPLLSGWHSGRNRAQLSILDGGA